MGEPCELVVQHIQSFVVYDLESTGLPRDGDPKITELAMYAISRQNLLSCTSYEDIRVVNKLVLCINPQASVHPVAAELTGLNNEVLKYENKFDHSTFQSLNGFLERLPRPVCLVAHNGHDFDFPLLQAELCCLGERLQDDLLCVDSLHLFKRIIQRGSTSPSKMKLCTYKLSDLYSFLVSETTREKEHNGEADVIALIKCILARNQEFVHMADESAGHYNVVKKMW